MDINTSKYTNTCRICFENQEKGVYIFSDEAKELYLQTKIRKYLYITVSMFFEIIEHYLITK